MSMLLLKLVPTGMVVVLPSTLAVNVATAHANALLAVPPTITLQGFFLQPWFAAISTVLFDMCSETRSCCWILIAMSIAVTSTTAAVTPSHRSRCPRCFL